MPLRASSLYAETSLIGVKPLPWASTNPVSLEQRGASSSVVYPPELVTTFAGSALEGPTDDARWGARNWAIGTRRSRTSAGSASERQRCEREARYVLTIQTPPRCFHRPRRRHLQGVRAVIVGTERELPQLLQELGLSPAEHELALGDQRLEGRNPGVLVAVVGDSVYAKGDIDEPGAAF